MPLPLTVWVMHSFLCVSDTFGDSWCILHLKEDGANGVRNFYRIVTESDGKGLPRVSVKDALQLMLEFAMFVVALLALVVQLIVVIMTCC